MGWLSDLFGTSDPPPQTTVVQSGTTLPSWMTDAARRNVGIAELIAAQPYPAYQGARIAPMTADQLAGFEAIRQGAGVWEPGVATAETAARDVAETSFPTADIAAYMNPYRNAISDDIRRRGEIERNQIAARAAQADAFGGSRQGVLEGMQREAESRSLSEAEANAFQTAMDAYYRDKASRLSGGQTLADLAAKRSALSMGDAAAIGSVGSALQQQGQQNLDVLYQDFLRQQQYPQEMLGLRVSTLAGAPKNTSSSSTTTAPGVAGPNPWATAAGLGIAGLGALSGGPGIASNFGALTSGISSLFGGRQ